MLVIIPTGEEPDMLLWPMPMKYKGGDKVVAVDSTNIRFHVNFESEEMTNAILRYYFYFVVSLSFKQTIFTRRFAEAPENAIKEVNIIIEKKEVVFEVVDATPS